MLVPQRKSQEDLLLDLLVGRSSESLEASLQGPSSWLSPSVQSLGRLLASGFLGSPSPQPLAAGHHIPGLQQWSLMDLRAQTLVTYMTSVYSCFLEPRESSTMRPCSEGTSVMAPSASAGLPGLSFFCRAQKLPPMKRAADIGKKLDM